MAEIRHLENRHDVIFSAEGGPIWIKLWRLVHNRLRWCGRNRNHMRNSNMADVWANSMAYHPRATYHIAGCCHLANSMSWSQSYMSHCRVLPLGEFTVMIPELHATLQGAVSWRNQCHDRATLQGVRIPSAILKIVFRHILFCFVF